MGTPHNQAERGAIAKVVLMPGDPLRARYIADTYLKDVVCFNTVRNMFGYTGTYQGVELSVMGSGMGMPSIGIYSYELYREYDVEVIIRIGSAGAYTDDLRLFDLVLADSAWSESSYALAQAGVEGDIQLPDAAVNQIIEDSARQLGYSLRVTRIHSSDVFYHEASAEGPKDFYEKHGCACVEMESFALFHNARVLGKKAACLLTISDSLISAQNISAQERETSFRQMMEVALESARRLSAVEA